MSEGRASPGTAPSWLPARGRLVLSRLIAAVAWSAGTSIHCSIDGRPSGFWTRGECRKLSSCVRVYTGPPGILTMCSDSEGVKPKSV